MLPSYFCPPVSGQEPTGSSRFWPLPFNFYWCQVSFTGARHCLSFALYTYVCMMPRAIAVRGVCIAVLYCNTYVCVTLGRCCCCCCCCCCYCSRMYSSSRSPQFSPWSVALRTIRTATTRDDSRQDLGGDTWEVTRKARGGDIFVQKRHQSAPAEFSR